MTSNPHGRPPLTMSDALQGMRKDDELRFALASERNMLSVRQARRDSAELDSLIAMLLDQLGQARLNLTPALSTRH